MRFLLDTHIFLWFITGSDRLSERFVHSIRDPKNDVYLSVVSVWEAMIKYQLGRLPLPASPGSYLPEQRKRHGVLGLQVDEASIARLAEIPMLHRDPFDRMMICQAIEHDLTLVTADDAVQAYPVGILKA